MKPSKDITPPTSKKLLPDEKKAKEAAKIKPKKKRKPPRKKPGIQKQKIKISKPKEETITVELTEKQKVFCKEYILSGWNGVQAYMKVYDCQYDSAKSQAHKLITNNYIQAYIVELQKDSEKLIGISKEKIGLAFLEMTDATMASYHNTWMSKKDFEALTPAQKACISEIETRDRTIHLPGGKKIHEQEIKFKVYSRADALKELKKMYGYDAPVKQELTGKDGADLIPVKINDITIHHQSKE
jgi:phage terminase small subunit